MEVKEEESSGTPLELFLKIGLDERTARNTIANNKVTNNLTAVIHEVFNFFSFFSIFRKEEFLLLIANSACTGFMFACLEIE
jgi:hypothetical protein